MEKKKWEREKEKKYKKGRHQNFMGCLYMEVGPVKESWASVKKEKEGNENNANIGSREKEGSSRTKAISRC